MSCPGLTALDAHTIQCPQGDVTYVPIPPGVARSVAGLMSLELPEGVRRGQSFEVTVHQISGRPRKTLGSFQLNIPISTNAVLLGPEMQRLSVFRYIAQGLPKDDPWRAVLERFLGQVAARVKGFGGNPDSVAAASDGSGVDKATLRCRRIGLLYTFLVALLVVVAGVHPLPGFLVELVVLVLAVVVGVYWWIACKPSPCRIVLASALGIVLGAAVLGQLALLGLGGASLIGWLAGAAAVGGLLLAAALAAGCGNAPPSG